MSEYKTDFDLLLKQLDEKESNPERLVTENPTPNTQRLFDFLKEIRGKRFISGQQYLFESELEDVVYKSVCGKIPALRGYDFMGISSPRRGYDQIRRALDWGRSGGILTMCWHWYAPDDVTRADSHSAFYYKSTDYDRTTSFDSVRAVTEGTLENAFIIREIDMVAEALKEFMREDIPVIWRPLHEANGGWFWWGNHGSNDSVEAYKKLWYIIFDRFTNLHGLKNLIWVWNGQDDMMSVHPNTFDIVGDDIYADPPSHASQIERYRFISSFGKLSALTECGCVPDPEEMLRDGTDWLWWMPWWGSFVYDVNEQGRPALDENGAPRLSPKYWTEDFMRRVMNDERVITFDSIPWRDGS